MLRNRNFALLWVAQGISAAGDTFTFLAMAVQIDYIFPDAGQSAKALGIVLIGFSLPQLLLGMFAGTLVDRWDRRKVMIASDLIRALLTPCFMFVQTAADLPLAFGLAFLISSFSVFFYPSRTALLPAIIDDDALMNANGWMQVGGTIARLSGPVLAGLVLGRWSVDVAFGIDGVSYLISAALLLGIRGVPTRVDALQETDMRAAWGDLKSGVQFALHNRLLQGVTLGLSVAMLGLGAVNVLFVPFLRHVFNAPPEALGGIQAAQGAGMLIGGLMVGAIGKRLSPLWLSVSSMFLLGAGVALFGAAPTYSLELIIMPIIGLSLAPINASLQTMLQRNVPGHMLGRAGSVMEMAISMATLVSMGVAGWLGDTIGFRQCFLFGGAMLALGGLAMGTLLRGESVSMPAAIPMGTLGATSSRSTQTKESTF